MDHNAYAVDLKYLNQSNQLFTATYHLYVGDANGNPVSGYGDTTTTWRWQGQAVVVVPTPGIAWSRSQMVISWPPTVTKSHTRVRGFAGGIQLACRDQYTAFVEWQGDSEFGFVLRAEILSTAIRTMKHIYVLMMLTAFSVPAYSGMLEAVPRQGGMLMPEVYYHADTDSVTWTCRASASRAAHAVAGEQSHR